MALHILSICVILVFSTKALNAQEEAIVHRCYGPNMEYRADLGHCVCTDGNYGDPDFFCSAHMNTYCTVKEPQLLRSFHGDHYFYDYPCIQQIAELKIKHNNTEERLNVFLSGHYISNGRIALDGMGMRVADLHFFVINGRFADTASESLVLSNIPPGWADNLFMFDKHTLVFHSQDVMIMFRPVTKNIKNNYNMPPGLQISYADGSRHTHELYELCSHTDGEFEDAVDNVGYKYREIYSLKVSIEAYDQLEESGDKFLVSNDLRGVCNAISNAYASCVIDHQTHMLNTCGPLLTNSVIRICLSLLGFRVLDVFHLCIRATCLDDRAACNELIYTDAIMCASFISSCNERKHNSHVRHKRSDENSEEHGGGNSDGHSGGHW